MFIANKKVKNKQYKTIPYMCYTGRGGGYICSSRMYSKIIIMTIRIKIISSNPISSRPITIKSYACPPPLASNGYIVIVQYTGNMYIQVAAVNGWLCGYINPIHHNTCTYSKNNPKYNIHINTTNATNAER